MVADIQTQSDANLTTYIESLHYAEIIQRGLLPKRRHFNRLFDDFFVFYKPLNILSGDFYWIGTRDHLTYLAVGDCTGHGVPGALLSVLASNILSYSIMNKGIVKTNKILKEVDKKFIESFSGIKDERFNNDWVDIALVCIDRKENRLYFSSANRKICIVSAEKDIRILEGSPYPIGGWQIETDRNFESNSIAFKPGDTLYIGSDGFQDQIGGEREKKFSSKRLHFLLAQNSQMKFSDQRIQLEKEFNDWKGKLDQIDDVCLVGVKL